MLMNMKRIEDIEKLTLEDLERLSDDESVAVPGSLGESIENRILASEILRHDSPRPPMRLWKRIVPVFAAAKNLNSFLVHQIARLF